MSVLDLLRNIVVQKWVEYIAVVTLFEKNGSFGVYILVSAAYAQISGRRW